MRRGRWFVNSVTLNRPIKNVFMFKTTPEEEIFEQLSVFGVVWSLLKLKLSAMSHILGKFL
jgi:hypothetical protein